MGNLINRAISSGITITLSSHVSFCDAVGLLPAAAITMCHYRCVAHATPCHDNDNDDVIVMRAQCHDSEESSAACQWHCQARLWDVLDASDDGSVTMDELIVLINALARQPQTAEY